MLRDTVEPRTLPRMSVPPIDPASADAVREALAAYLAARDDTRTARIVEPPAPLGSGFDSFIYTFRLDGAADARWSAPLVLRLQGKPEQALKVRREADVQAFLVAAGYPMPALLAAEDAANAFGLPFMIMERVPGSDDARARDRRTRCGRADCSRGWRALHADLHRLPQAGWPLDDGDEPIVLRQIAQFRRRVEEQRLDGLRDGLDWLERNAPAVLPETAVITHNDFHPLNVLVTDEGRLSVIDWSDAALGDRHHDVARTLTLFSFAYIAASSSFERLLLKAARGFLRSRYFNAYERAFPRRPAPARVLRGAAVVERLAPGHANSVSETNAARATDAARGLPPNLVAEVEATSRRRMADAERDALRRSPSWHRRADRS